MSDTIRKGKITDDIIDTESEVMFGVLSGAQLHLKGLKASARHLTQWCLISYFRV